MVMSLFTEKQNRRKAITNAISLVGGALAGMQWSAVAAAVAAAAREGAPRYLSPAQFAMVERVVDLIIPATDTPGAYDAGVHWFVDLMLAEWASEEKRSRYLESLEGIDELARQLMSADFVTCSEVQQFDVLQEMDNRAFAPDNEGHVFRDLKKLVLYGYYSSEPGATLELRYSRIPGSFQACQPLGEDGRAWATSGWRYDL
jgi:hypothetical protein